MEAKLRGKTALVTGGTSGIGQAIAEALALEGVRVAIASRACNAKLAKSLSVSSGQDAISLAVDVSVEEEVQRMVDEVVREFGQLDLFVNNAAQAQHQPITKIETAAYRKIIDTNLSACLWSCRAVGAHMVDHGDGAILVVGSTSMYTPGPTETVYRIAKFGLKAIVENLAIELAPFGVRANLLVPGHYRTRLTENIPAETEARLKQEIPLRRFGATSDCASAAVFLLSDALSGYTTGAELVVDGGLSLRPLYFGDDDELRRLNATE